MRWIGEEEGPLECPQCRGEAAWRFLDEEKSLVEILCSDCGRIEMSRTEFEQAESELASHYFHARLSDQFDAVIHFDQTRAVEPL